MHVLLSGCPPPHTAHARLAARYDTTFLLESRDGPQRLARYTFLGFDPAGTLCLERGLRVTGALPEPLAGQDPLEYLRRIQAFYATDDRASPFVGGLVGAAGYDLARTLEPRLEASAGQRSEGAASRDTAAAGAHPGRTGGRRAPADENGGVAVGGPVDDGSAKADLPGLQHEAAGMADLPGPAHDAAGIADLPGPAHAATGPPTGEASPWPRLLFGLYLDGVVYDHVAGTVAYVSRGPDRLAALHEALGEPEPDAPLSVGAVRPDRDEAKFVAQVAQAQEAIRAGEAFQIVLSRAFHGTFQGSLVPLYSWLREHAPVPYLFHLRFAGRQLVGASPECLVRVRRGVAETFPIAGTRPVTGDAATDAAAAEALLADPKETAEHAMLVDLARNDLARVCTPGTVQVTIYQQTQTFRDVMHLVSRVQGELASGRDAWSALAAVYPAGTVSGAPKIRAMEHIDAIEDAARHPRGAYAGAVCYASFNGDFDSAITIRSLSAAGQRLTVQAGAGIVHRSDPHAEWMETAHKARTLLCALERFGARIETAPAAIDAAQGRTQTSATGAQDAQGRAAGGGIAASARGREGP